MNSRWEQSMDAINVTCYNSVITKLFFLKQGSMLYWALFEGKTPFNKLWPSYDKRAK